MAVGLNYNLNLPDDLSTILEQDFWMWEDVNGDMISSISEPIKFAASTWIVVYRGECAVDINLQSYEISGPTLVNVRSMQIMQPKAIGKEFSGGVFVMSKRISENISMFLNSSPLSVSIHRHPVVPIPEELVPDFKNFFKETRAIFSDVENPYGSQALLHQILLFFFKTIYKCFMPFVEEDQSSQGRISDQFLQLVNDNFRKERFLDFYAEKLEITPKHLSRTVKQQTGFSAVEWIERFVILEAKVLLKSSNLNIQQIADELNFPSQSFFGKYFKKVTGMSPREFRFN